MATNDIFIKSITVNKVRHLKDITIPISDTERKHLILTGKNGSGKTSLLEVMKDYIYIRSSESFEKERTDMLTGNPDLEVLPHINLEIENAYSFVNEFLNNKFIVSYFESKRSSIFKPTNSITIINSKKSYNIDEKANSDFVQLLVNLKAQRSFARDENREKTVQSVDKWFESFENILKDIFDDDELHLAFDSQNFEFNILQKNREKFDLNTLSDGYSAIFNIITEIVSRMIDTKYHIFDTQGIVLIDEIETHLHIDLQKKILPFLTTVFPKIQFIVTTHSPFVLSSLPNSVIYDLENHLLVEDLSGYSMDGIVEGYFNSDKFSVKLKNQIQEYEMLLQKKNRNPEEDEKVRYFNQYFDDLPKFLAPELRIKVRELKLQNL